MRRMMIPAWDMGAVPGVGVSRERVWIERGDKPIIRFHPKALPSR